jgi:GDP-L-fucose synthase
MAAIAANLILTVQMLQAAWDEQVERFLVFSSSTGYPESGVPLKEEEMWTGPTHPVYFGYGWMRRYLERLSEFIAKKSELKIALARPTAVYGRRDNFDPITSHVIPALIRRAVEREDPYLVGGDGNEVRDFLHITDLVRGCLLLLEKYPVCDPVNIGYGSAVTIRDIVSIILHAAEFPQVEVIYDNAKPSTIPFRMIDIEKAEKILGFTPQVTLDEGITDTVLWYQKNRTGGE